MPGPLSPGNYSLLFYKVTASDNRVSGKKKNIKIAQVKAQIQGQVKVANLSALTQKWNV